jgi:nitroreductase
VENTEFTRQTHALLCGLRSVRSFTPEPIPEAALNDILTVARWTGSAVNLQPWHIVVVQDPARLQALARCEGYVAHVDKAPLGLVLAMDQSNTEFADFDEGRLAERICIAAATHGLGSVTAWWAGQGRSDAARILNVPSGSAVRTIVSIGYSDGVRPAVQTIADPAAPTAARKPLSNIVVYEQF